MNKRELVRTVRALLLAAGHGRAYRWESGWAKGKDGHHSQSAMGHVSGFRIEPSKIRNETVVHIRFEKKPNLNRKVSPLHIFRQDCRERAGVLMRYQQSFIGTGLVVTLALGDDETRDWPYLKVEHFVERPTIAASGTEADGA